MSIQKVELLRDNPGEHAPKASESLRQMRDNADALVKLRHVILQEKLPVVNETEDRLHKTATAMNALHESIRATAPDFYQAD